jgi:hypothetical protein
MKFPADKPLDYVAAPGTLQAQSARKKMVSGCGIHLPRILKDI